MTQQLQLQDGEDSRKTPGGRLEVPAQKGQSAAVFVKS